ncbi:MAG: nucleotidyltransferase family protein [Desulfosarcina sp.]|nr:nucleotidyltransferase family protein [Desulfobacterales bacterium]
MSDLPSQFTAVVLAADRTIPDPVAQAAGVSCKAMVPVDGIPMITRVIMALRGSKAIGSIILCGPPWTTLQNETGLQQLLDSESIQWLPNRETPSTSAAAALQTLAAETPVLLTTADHALLTPAILDYFCTKARHAAADVLVALAHYDAIMQAYPGMRRTATRFQDGPFCSCNLFAILTSRGRTAADFWRRVERERKTPWKMINKLGWLMVLKYLLGRLTLAEGLRRASQQLGFRASAVLMPFPEAAVDVDTPADWHFVQDIVKESIV